MGCAIMNFLLSSTKSFARSRKFAAIQGKPFIDQSRACVPSIATINSLPHHNKEHQTWNGCAAVKT
jgi:hypothetical protein